jgi:acetyl-CoA carboxylase carboxyltransferase component
MALRNAFEEVSTESTLRRLLNILMSPIGFDKSLNRQRVTALLEAGSTTAVTGSLTSAGTVSTVTTVTTVTGLTNIDSRNGSMLIDQTNKSAWALSHRARIT